MEQVELLAYVKPAIVDTFEACEVLGAADGLVCGLGSQMCA
jgi:hypothetical protein